MSCYARSMYCVQCELEDTRYPVVNRIASVQVEGTLYCREHGCAAFKRLTTPEEE